MQKRIGTTLTRR